MYIEEAHPTDAWQVESNVRDAVLFASAKNSKEKSETAGVCVRKLGIKIPALVDDVRNTVEQRYTGWPDRLYVIDRDGRIAHKSAPGPYGFKPSEVEAKLKQIL